MRLTANLIDQTGQYTNAIKDREVDLRGYKIPTIENLSATKDLFDSIDLSDNEIQALENFPVLKRLRAIYLNNNRINKIGKKFGKIFTQFRSPCFNK